jgi:hypothetical protein
MPKWVDKCVTRYKKKGVSKDEAWKRCMGAYKKRQKQRKRKALTND